METQGSSEKLVPTYLPTYLPTWRHILGDCNLKPHTRYSMTHRLTNWHLWKVISVRN